jgi:hypothetical protein
MSSSQPPDDEHLQQELSEKRERIDQIKQEMWDMKLEMSRLKKEILSKELSYKRIKEDPDYKHLVELLGQSENWEDGFEDEESKVKIVSQYKRLYLTLKEADEQRKKDPTFKKVEGEEETWKLIPSNVYVKEFAKSKEELEAELKRQKGITEQEEREAKANRQSKFLILHNGINRLRKVGDDLKHEAQKIKDLQRELPTKEDITKYFGENTPSKIAALVVIIASIVLFRYGVDNGYISPLMRLFTGLGIGGGLFALSHHLVQKKFNLTTIINMLAGLVLYYTIYLAHAEYFYIPQLIAFVLTLVVTIGSISLAYFYDRKGLAISTLLGGYIVPMLLLGENDHFAWFFLYVFLLNVVMMVVGYLKKWRIVNVMGTLTTAFLIYIEFVDIDFTMNDRLFWVVVLATAFYWIFYLANVIYTVRPDVPFKSLDAFLLIFVTGLYSYKMLKFLPLAGQGELLGIFFAGMAVYNLAAVWILYGNRAADEPLVRLLMGKVIFCGIVSGFFLMHQVYFNGYLAGSALLLYYLANSLKVPMLKDFSTYLMLATIASLVYLWSNTYFGILENIQFFVNEGFLASIFTLTAISIHFFWVLEEKDLPELAFFSRVNWLSFLFILLTSGIYISFFLEIYLHTPNIVGGNDFRALLLGFYTLSYQLGMYFLSKKYHIPKVEDITKNLMIVASLSYILVGHSETIALRDAYMSGGSLFPFLFHYLNIACIIGLIILKINDIIEKEGMENPKFVYLSWYAMAMAVFLATFESEHILIFWQAHPETLSETLITIRVVWYSILWTMIAFGFMYLGITRQQKDLRIISLVLMSITLAKFIFHDFWALSPLSKILSVIIVGLLMYAVSRMYAHLHKLVEEGKMERIRIEKLEHLKGKVNDVAEKLNLKKQAEKIIKGNEKLQKMNDLVNKMSSKMRTKKEEEPISSSQNPSTIEEDTQTTSKLGKLTDLVGKMTDKLKERKELEKSVNEGIKKITDLASAKVGWKVKKKKGEEEK